MTGSKDDKASPYFGDNYKKKKLSRLVGYKKIIIRGETYRKIFCNETAKECWDGIEHTDIHSIAEEKQDVTFIG